MHRPSWCGTSRPRPEFSLEPKTWWYPLVGSLDYRGYFSKDGAQKYGARLQTKGYDVYVGGVDGVFDAGLVQRPGAQHLHLRRRADLAETLFHELGHQRVFASGDTDFNEAFATTVGQEGARRWLRAKGEQAALADYLAELRRTAEFVRLIAHTRGSAGDALR